MRIERATGDDGPAILQLLADCALPIAGVLDHLDTALIARDENRVVGCAALEIYADGALLRSVAVDSSLARQGVGTQLTKAALDLAAALAVGEVFLLTTTAEGFFPRFGFEATDRAHVPASILASIEFVSACPTTAIVMRRAWA